MLHRVADLPAVDHAQHRVGVEHQIDVLGRAVDELVEPGREALRRFAVDVSIERCLDVGHGGIEVTLLGGVAQLLLEACRVLDVLQAVVDTLQTLHVERLVWHRLGLR